MDGPSRRPTDSSRSEGTPSPSEGPSGGAKTFWLLLGRLPKVTRCNSGTLSGRDRSNGYEPRPTTITPPDLPEWPLNSHAHHEPLQKSNPSNSPPCSSIPPVPAISRHRYRSA